VFRNSVGRKQQGKIWDRGERSGQDKRWSVPVRRYERHLVIRSNVCVFHVYNNLLSSCSRVFPEKPIVLNLVKEFPTIYDILIFITDFTVVCLWTKS
jgi:hypothetical protein